MAIIKSPSLFFVTSPRTPFKMRSEIDLLVKNFAGQKWNANTRLQADFMRLLVQQPEFEGAFNPNDPALSARDRITRGPKALGFVNLDNISLTAAGTNFLDADLAEEALLRQLLKFQLPSPFHKSNQRLQKNFYVKPYLEIIRLIYTLGRLAFDELCLFGMQLTDWHDFEKVVEDVRQFRINKEAHRGQYKKFLFSEKKRIVKDVFANEIARGEIQTREASQNSLENFISTKGRNMRDYGDACLRYLRASGLVTVSNPGRTISIIESRRDEVEYILNTIDRNPIFITDANKYCENLFSADTPVLLTDDRNILVNKAIRYVAVSSFEEAERLTLPEIKKRIKHAQEAHREAIVNSQITELKAFTKYDDIINIFNGIKAKDVYDPPLAFEWNVWRTMTMMDGGNIRGNFSFDDAGNPLSTAPGNTPDIVCDYGDFTVTVEVTLMSGNTQYNAEAEPVARHLGDIKKQTNRPAFCLFISPTINISTISHFFMLHKTNVRHYGGRSVVIPLKLERFINMLTQAKNCGYVPDSEKIRRFCEFSMDAANVANDEEEWYNSISNKADDWLA